MDLRRMCQCATLILLAYTCHAAIDESLYHGRITVDDQTYWLSQNDGNYTTAKAKCRSELPADLVFFDDTDEYWAVAQYLSDNRTTDVYDVWIDIVKTDRDNDHIYEYWWKNEQIPTNVWHQYPSEPGDFCMTKPNTCCERMSWDRDTKFYKHLRAITCDVSFHYLCKARNECLDGTAVCSQVCVDTPLNYTCKCNAGFSLAIDGISCDDVDECARADLCDQICHNTFGSYSCSCNDGYFLRGDQYTCMDVDECAKDSAGCHHNCENMEGTFYCSCKDGYELQPDNSTCQDIDECVNGNVSCQHTCINLEGGFQCICDEGYSLAADNSTCNDVDECASESRICPGACTNTDGGYVCGCPSGFEDVGVSCADIDECKQDIHNCSQICLNTHGSYNCACREGFVKSAETEFGCEDIDECQEGLHNCSHHCHNSGGSYSCTCSTGYRQDTEDETACTDIDECRENPSICDHMCNNTDGSYFCSCHEGYRFAEDKVSCIKKETYKVCPCSCKSRAYMRNITKRNVFKMVENIRTKLLVRRQLLTSTKRKLTSAQDIRMTSQTVGYSGVAFIVIPLGFIIVPDLFAVIHGLAVATAIWRGNGHKWRM